MLTALRRKNQALLHLELFRKSVADELEALEMRCHLYPVNSIGYGGVHNNFVEALDWLGPTDAKDTNLLSRLEGIFPLAVNTDSMQGVQYSPYSRTLSAGFEAQAESYKELLRRGISEQRVASRAMYAARAVLVR